MRSCLPIGALLLLFTATACSMTEDERSNPRDPKFGTTGSGGGPKADLIITAFNTAASYTNNVTYNFSVTVKNQGNAAAGGFTVAVDTGSTSGSLNYALAYSSSFAGKTIVGSLAAGASTTVTVSFEPIFTFHGLIGAYVDTTETVSESNEGNNYQLNNVIIN